MAREAKYYRHVISASDSIFREFLLGFIKIHILHHAARGPVYGLWLLRELRRHGYELSPGTLYPVLHALQRQGYLRCHERAVSGKRRKYYHITDLGQRALNEARARMTELVAEVMARPGPGEEIESIARDCHGHPPFRRRHL